MENIEKDGASPSLPSLWLELHPNDPEFWSQNLADLVEADYSFKATALFTLNSPSIKEMKFFAITEGSCLVYKNVRSSIWLISLLNTKEKRR